MKAWARLAASLAAAALLCLSPASAQDLSSQVLPFPVVFVGNTEVDLKWSPFAGSGFQHYLVKVSGKPDVTISAQDTAFYRVAGLAQGSAYTFQVCTVSTTKTECTAAVPVTTGQVEGTIYQDLTWSAGTYTMKAQVYVQSGATLTIPAATTVRSSTAGTAVTLSAALSDPAKRGVIRVDGATLRDIGLTLGPGSSLQNGTVTGGSVTARFYDPGSATVSGTQFTNSRVQVLPPEVPASVSVTGNTFRTQEPFSGITFVEVHDATAIIEGNQFYLGPPSTRPHTGITVAGNCGTATVRNNYLEVKPTTYTTVGMLLWTSPTCTVSVTGNVVKDFAYGIQALADVNGTIEGNTLKATSASIEVRGNSPVTVSQNCLVAGADISAFRGLLVTEGTTLANPPRTTALDARNNWWGHSTGPYYPTDNPTGEGSRIQAASGKVLFSPWLTANNCRDSVSVPCVRVRDANGADVAGAEVFVNNTYVGLTDAQGKLCTMMGLGDALVARLRVREVPTLKSVHNQDSDANWGLRVYRTSMDPNAKGEPAPRIVTDISQEQVLVLQETNPLFGFNIVVSVEWEATAEYIQHLRQGFAAASQYLYDVTNGQMLFERVTIYQHGQNLAQADYQIRASNQDWPRSNVTGILKAANHVMLGRFFSGASVNSGPWSQPIGYRTMIHEFGHYGLGLYDSYFFYQGATKVRGHCTGPEIRTNTTWDTNATIMDSQRNSSELAMEGVAGLWSPMCYQTQQYQRHDMSDWDVVEVRFAGLGALVRTPSAVVAGPSAVPVSAWTTVTAATTHNAGACSVPPLVTFIAPDGSPMVFRVDLQRASGQVVSQGTTDRWGNIVVLGGGEGDRLIYRQTWPVTASPASGSVAMTCAEMQTVRTGIQPLFLDFTAEPGPAANQVAVRVIPSAAVQGLPILSVYQTGAAGGVTVTMAPQAAGFSGVADLDAALPLEAKAVVSATGAAGTVHYVFSFAIHAAAAAESTTLWSTDGQAELYLPAGTLSADARIAIQPVAVATVAAGSFEAQATKTELVPLVGPYQITVTGGTLEKGASLSLFYSDAAGLAPGTDPATGAIYRWAGGQWTPLESTLDEEHRYVSAAISEPGVYALWAKASWRTYVPLLAK